MICGFFALTSLTTSMNLSGWLSESFSSADRSVSIDLRGILRSRVNGLDIAFIGLNWDCDLNVLAGDTGRFFTLDFERDVRPPLF